MSNWVAMEWEKFKGWVESHAKTTNSRLDALEERVAAVEREVEINAPPPPSAS